MPDYLLPVRLADVQADITFHDAPEEAVTIGSATVRAANVAHQGPTVGYRIEENGMTLAYLPDHEPSLGRYAPSLSKLNGFPDVLMVRVQVVLPVLPKLSLASRVSPNATPAVTALGGRLGGIHSCDPCRHGGVCGVYPRP